MDHELSRLLSLRVALSEPRLGRYLAAFNDDVRVALECHHWNSRISHALFLPIQLFELTLRNKLDAKIGEVYGKEWLINWPDWLYDAEGRENRQRRKVEESINHILYKQKKVVSHSKIIAELRFSFWVHLLGKSYLETLWVPHLRHCFPGSNGSRQEVHERAEKLLDLRNRISHHEPILFEKGGIKLRDKEDVAALFAEAAEAIGWLCDHTRAFVEERCLCGDLLRAFEAFFESAQVAHSRSVSRYSGRRLEQLRIALGRLKFFDPFKGFGYVEIRDHQDVRVEKETLIQSGIEEVKRGQRLEVTFEFVGRSAIARSLRFA